MCLRTQFCTRHGASSVVPLCSWQSMSPTYTSHPLKHNLQGRPLLYTSLLFFDIQLLSEENCREKELWWGSLSRKEPESDALMEYLFLYILYPIHIAQYMYLQTLAFIWNVKVLKQPVSHPMNNTCENWWRAFYSQLCNNALMQTF